jgi:hypothetical protein
MCYKDIQLADAIMRWRDPCSHVSSVTYELGFYMPEDGILHSYSNENLKPYIALTAWAL